MQENDFVVVNENDKVSNTYHNEAPVVEDREIYNDVPHVVENNMENPHAGKEKIDITEIAIQCLKVGGFLVFFSILITLVILIAKF